jgi:hypothetical protein
MSEEAKPKEEKPKLPQKRSKNVGPILKRIHAIKDGVATIRLHSGVEFVFQCNGGKIITPDPLHEVELGEEMEEDGTKFLVVAAINTKFDRMLNVSDISTVSIKG